MKLFLSGGGSGEDSIELDKLFVESLDKRKPLLYIPIAIDKVKHPYSDCLNWIKSSLGPLGLKEIELWTEQDLREKSEKELEKFCGIYIGGGNTFYLLKEFKESGFLRKLDKLIKKGIPVYGGSAGAVIHGKTIIPALSADPNEVKLEDFNALNLIKNYDLWCHYEPCMDQDIKEYINKYKLRIIALPENCGLYVQDEKIEVIGKGSAILFDGNRKEVLPGEKIWEM